MKKIVLVVCLFLISTPSWALREYYSLTRSPRALSMGGAFYGLSDDEYALFYNPAGLALYRGNTQVMLGVDANLAPKTPSAISSISSLGNSDAGSILNTLQQYQGTPLYGNAGVMPYFLHKHIAVGLLLADAKVDMAILGANLDTTIDATVISDSALVVGYGTTVWDGLSVGANLKGVFRAGGQKTFTVLDIAQGSGFNIDPKTLGGMGFGVDFDLGAIYEFTGVPYTLTNHVGLSLNNMLASQLPIGRTGSPPGLTRMLSLGYHTVFPGYGWIDNFHFLFDLAEFGIGGNDDPDFGGRGESIWKHVNFGTEIPMNGWFIVRAGVHQGYFTAGIGLSSPLVKFDLLTYEEDLGYSVNRLSSRRFMARLAIGGGSSSAGEITGPYAGGRPDSARGETKEAVPPAETKPDSNKLDKAEPKKIETEVKPEAPPEPLTKPESLNQAAKPEVKPPVKSDVKSDVKPADASTKGPEAAPTKPAVEDKKNDAKPQNDSPNGQ